MNAPGWVWLAVLAAGAAGSLLRYAVVSLTPSDRAHPPSPSWPTGVLVANTVASFVVGLVAGMPASSTGRLILTVGLGGGLSTLSTLAVDTVALWHHGRRGAALANVALTVVLGLAAAVLGARLARVVGVA
jgi:CrcB protein